MRDLQDDSTTVEKPDGERGGTVLLMKVDERKCLLPMNTTFL